MILISIASILDNLFQRRFKSLDELKDEFKQMKNLFEEGNIDLKDIQMMIKKPIDM